jgi:hypothetical protein
METIRDCFSMENRIIRHHGYFYHPRTGELVLGIEHDEVTRPSFTSKYASLVTPAVRYHSQANKSCGATLRTIMFCDVGVELKQIVDGSTVVGHPTGQWKSVWYSKGMRRK